MSASEQTRLATEIAETTPDVTVPASPTLLERTKPFPKRLIHSNPSGGGSYVKHSVVVQRLLDLFDVYDFELVQVIRGEVAGIAPNPDGKSAKAKAGSPPLADAIVGAVCRLTVEVDGRPVRIEEVGDCEQPHNWPHDGARMKDAMSDAIKRCAARLGIGLHLWAQDEAYLHQRLANEAAAADGETT